MATREPNEPMPRGDATDPGDLEEEISDGSLLRLVQTGREDASTALYLRYAERLRALAAAQSAPDLARRVDPEDIVQSVFRTFFRRASLGHYSVPDGEELWKLLLVIALNKVRATGAHHRAAKRDIRRTEGGESFDRAIDAIGDNDETALHVLRLAITELLETVPEVSRRMIELRIEGHEVAEIATTVGRSKRTVERELQEFRTRLDSLIAEDR